MDKLLIYSIFAISFHSFILLSQLHIEPIFTTENRFRPNYKSGQEPAKRVFLFIVDQLSGSTFYDDLVSLITYLYSILNLESNQIKNSTPQPVEAAPYLKSQLKKGTYGYLKTNFPINSKYGFLSILAGLNEKYVGTYFKTAFYGQKFDIETLAKSAKNSWFIGSSTYSSLLGTYF